MEMFLLDNGKMIKLMEVGNTLPETGPLMKASGLKINAVGRGNNNGQMEQCLLDCMQIIKKTGEENLNGRMEITIREILKIIENLDKAR